MKSSMCNIDITVVVQHNVSVVYSLNVYWSAENGDDTHMLIATYKMWNYLSCHLLPKCTVWPVTSKSISDVIYQNYCTQLCLPLENKDVMCY